jgi:hypothetical protein
MAKTPDYLPRRPDEKAPTTHHWKDATFAKDFPAIYSLLAVAFVDGSDRRGATITIFADQGHLKFAISDRHTEQSLFGTLPSPQGLWEGLESFVLAHPEDWQEKREAGNKGRKG